MKTVEEYFKIYCKDQNMNSLLEMFLIEVREKIVINLDKNHREIIPQEYLDMIQIFDERWNAVADMTKDMDKPLNRRSFVTSIEIYYSHLYRRWKGLKKDYFLW